MTTLNELEEEMTIQKVEKNRFIKRWEAFTTLILCRASLEQAEYECEIALWKLVNNKGGRFAEVETCEERRLHMLDNLEEAKRLNDSLRKSKLYGIMKSAFSRLY